MVNTEQFPGNSAAFEKIVEAIAQGATAFTGAGTSMPSLPSWSGLTRDLLSEAQAASLLDASVYNSLIVEKDILYVADQLEDAFGRKQFKSRIASIFSSLQQPTPAHDELVKIKFRKYMTLNYDTGLEMAYAKEFREHMSAITARQSAELERWLTEQTYANAKAVLHWHGLTTHAEEVILSGSDYSDFYEASPQNKDNLRQIFRNNSVIMVGFGFQDPFITNQLESVMRVIAAENKHFAILGVDASTFNEQLERRKYSLKYKMDVLFYPVKADPDGSRDHSALIEVLKAIKSKIGAESKEQGSSVSIVVKPASEVNSYQGNLFTVGSTQIYCEPNLTRGDFAAGGKTSHASIADIIELPGNACIVAPHEYGLTTLGKRLNFEIIKQGQKSFFRDASSLPNYRKKLLLDPDIGPFHQGEPFTLIIDNFSPVDHERLAGELFSTFSNIKMILLQRNTQGLSIDSDYREDRSFALFELRGLIRSNIREVASCFVPRQQEDQLTSVVDKVYSDLVQLCIPLTPSNVIMYCSVLYKDGDFSPVSRLQIVDKFISSALQRASDSYTDSFNFSNKVELICRFCYDLFASDQTSFSQQQWTNYCSKYKTETLMNFNDREILSDLIGGGIIKNDLGAFVFRYKMFFSYFVGKYVAARPSIIAKFVDNNNHLELDGVIEVLCGMSTDSTIVLEDLTEKLEEALGNFYGEFPISGTCFHKSVEWTFADDEDEMWESVSKSIEEGPLPGEKVDRLKSSILAERRTVDQKVEIIKFVAFEKNVSMISAQLQRALESALYATAEMKMRATVAVLDELRLAYEVANVLAPMIAERKYVSWNGFGFINLLEDDEIDTDLDEAKKKMLSRVVWNLPGSIVRSAVDRFGSRKLGPVFYSLHKKTTAGFSDLLLFALLLRSRPEGWMAASSEMIAALRRDDLFLRHALSVTIGQYKNEVNSNIDRQNLKETIAAIKLRRDLGLKKPNTSAIRDAILQIEKSKMLDETEES